MKTLRQWLGGIKRRLLSLLEIKAGIMLCMPVPRAPGALISDTEMPQALRRAVDYRDDLHCSEPEFSRRCRKGNVLYELVVDGQPVCYGWVAEAGAHVGVLHELRLVVPAGAFYIWDCATAPACRGNGYFRTLLLGLVGEVYSTSTLALVAVDTGNKPSRRALASAGFLPAFTYISARVAGRGLLSVAFKGGKVSAAQAEFDRFDAV
ncbi:GNAT family N-acetyltransferase [Marinobacter sp.]|uniref:GNAT family N-acetyltransferase n=1 Tax=Marinobacter sp. TaxID=50741 RepID=UPI0034A18A98